MQTASMRQKWLHFGILDSRFHGNDEMSTEPSPALMQSQCLPACKVCLDAWKKLDTLMPESYRIGSLDDGVCIPGGNLVDATNWRKYEELTAQVLTSISEKWDTQAWNVLGWGAKNYWPSISGANRQVDVTADRSGTPVVAECKFYKNPLDVAEVEKFLGKLLLSLELKNGVMVALNGFSSEAKRLATRKGIHLWTLRGVQEKDWDGKLRNVSISLNMYMEKRTNEVLWLEVTHDTLWFPTRQMPVALIPPDARILGLEGGSETVAEIQLRIEANMEPIGDEVEPVKIDFPSGTKLLYIEQGIAEVRPVYGLSYDLQQVCVSTENLNIIGDEIVKYHVYDELSGKKLSIHYDGTVHETSGAREVDAI